MQPTAVAGSSRKGCYWGTEPACTLPHLSVGWALTAGSLPRVTPASCSLRVRVHHLVHLAPNHPPTAGRPSQALSICGRLGEWEVGQLPAGLLAEAGMRWPFLPNVSHLSRSRGLCLSTQGTWTLVLSPTLTLPISIRGITTWKGT